MVERCAWSSWRWDQRQRDRVVRQLHRVRVGGLMGGRRPAHTGLDRDAMGLEPRGAG
jgi:hypothetical protein